jgi:hypothetical protein
MSLIAGRRSAKFRLSWTINLVRPSNKSDARKNSKDKRLVPQLVRPIVTGGCEKHPDREWKGNQQYRALAELFVDWGLTERYLRFFAA